MTQLFDSIVELALVWQHQFARNLRVDTWNERISDHTGHVADRQLAGCARNSTTWYVGWSLPEAAVVLVIPKSVWFRILRNVEMSDCVVSDVRWAFLGQKNSKQLRDLVEFSKRGTRKPLTERCCGCLYSNTEGPCDEVVFVFRVTRV